MIGHLIAGERVDGASDFEARVHGGTRPFVRCGSAQFRRAVASLEPGPPPPERLLARAARTVREDADLLDDLAAALGVRAPDLPDRLAAVPRVHAAGGHRGAPAVTLLRAHWTDGVGELGRRLCGALASGAAVLLASDPRLPEAADAWARALLGAGLPPRRLALVHGLDPLDAARAPDAPPRARLVLDDEPAADAVRAAVGARRWALEWPRGRERTAGEPGCETPRRAFRSAFGLREALGGLLPGRPVVLAVPEREHAAWVDELVALGDRAREAVEDEGRDPVPAVDRAQAAAFRAAVARLLEQGATPVVASERRGDPRFAPTLFVGGEPWMDVVRRLPCVPVLVVRRVREASLGVGSPAAAG